MQASPRNDRIPGLRGGTHVDDSGSGWVGLDISGGVRWITGCCCCNRWAARVTQEISPFRIEVVRARARSDHWRWVSTPPQVCPGPGTSGKPGEQPVADQSRLTNTLQNYIQANLYTMGSRSKANSRQSIGLTGCPTSTAPTGLAVGANGESTAVVHEPNYITAFRNTGAPIELRCSGYGCPESSTHVLHWAWFFSLPAAQAQLPA